MITMAGLLSVVILPVIVATATFNIAVEGTENTLKKVGSAVADKFHKPKQ